MTLQRTGMIPQIQMESGQSTRVLRYSHQLTICQQQASTPGLFLNRGLRERLLSRLTSHPSGSDLEVL